MPVRPESRLIIEEILRYRRDGIPTRSTERVRTVESEEVAYAVQDEVIAELSQPVAGWKTGGFDPAVQSRLKLSEPFAGRILQNTVRNSPARIPHEIMQSCLLECEIGLRFGTDTAQLGPCPNRAEVSRAVVACLPVFELVTSTWDDRRLLTGVDFIADNGGCGGLVVGQEVTAWQDVDIEHQTICLLRSGETIVQKPIQRSWDEILDVAVWLVHFLHARGRHISPGQIVATGTLTGLTSLQQGDTAYADFGKLGCVSVSLAGKAST